MSSLNNNLIELITLGIPFEISTYTLVPDFNSLKTPSGIYDNELSKRVLKDNTDFIYKDSI